MGLTIFIKNDVEDGTYIKTYKCSKCNTIILKAPPTKYLPQPAPNLAFDESIDWDMVPIVCMCGETVLGPVTKFAPIIDVITNE